MRYLHAMIRVLDPKKTISFFCENFEMKVISERQNESARFTLYFLAFSDDVDRFGEEAPKIELTHNWDETIAYSSGRSFGHLAFEVENIYSVCERLKKNGVDLLRPPRDGKMAFVKTPDQISIELLQAGSRLEPLNPWKDMPNQGSW